MASQIAPKGKTTLDRTFIGVGLVATGLGLVLLLWPFVAGHFVVRPSFALAITVGGTGWIATALAAIRSEKKLEENSNNNLFKHV